jgi:hypothetical protein
MEVRMKSIAALTLGIVLAFGVASTENSALVRDPEIDFVNTPESVFADLGILRKNELLRLDLDLDGTGQLAVFLTFKSAGSKSGPGHGNRGQSTNLDKTSLAGIKWLTWREEFGWSIRGPIIM